MLQDAADGGARRRELSALFGRRGDEVHTAPRLHDVHRQEPDDERQRRHDLEVDDRAQSQLADALHVVAVPRDPHDQRGEQQWHDQRLDHLEEDRGEHVQIGRRPPAVRVARRLRVEPPNRDPDHHRHDYPLRQRDAPEERFRPVRWWTRGGREAARRDDIVTLHAQASRVMWGGSRPAACRAGASSENSRT